MIHFVGAGPGAPDLITMRSARLLASADVVIYAGSLVNPELLSLASKECTIHDSSRMTLEQVLAVMVEADTADKDVVRLHTGDPCLYGAIHEQMVRLDALGIAYDDTPGVSSLCGAAASLNAEYTIPGVSQSVIVTRLAGRTPVPDAEGLSALAAHGASMAIFLSAGMLGEVQAELLRGGYQPDCPAALVYKATWPDERVVRTTVGNLARDGRDADIHNTALILVGDFLNSDGERSRLYDPSFSTGYRPTWPEGLVLFGHDEPSCPNRTSPSGHAIRIVSFTDVGQALAEHLASELDGDAWRCRPGELGRWTAEGFADAKALVFVGAAGIAVRAIAPHVATKASDPAVVVVDEQGRFAVPLLSGHLGGANDLARLIEERCGARAIITTATDGREAFAVDEWARLQGCAVANPERIKHVSATILSGQSVRVHSDWPLPPEAPNGVEVVSTPDACDVSLSARTLASNPNVLRIVPRVLVLGVGCRKETPGDRLYEHLRNLMARSGYDPKAIACVCSIDLKAEEPGILELCKSLSVPLRTFSAQELARVPGTFSSSPFVRETVGVDNVCERSAVLGSDGGTLVHAKMAGDGITMALAIAPFAPDWRWSRG